MEFRKLIKANCGPSYSFTPAVPNLGYVYTQGCMKKIWYKRQKDQVFMEMPKNVFKHLTKVYASFLFPL